MRLVVSKLSGTTYVNLFIQWRETRLPHPDNELLFGPPFPEIRKRLFCSNGNTLSITGGVMALQLSQRHYGTYCFTAITTLPLARPVST